MLVKLENIISLKKDYHVLKVHFLGDLILNIIHADALSDTKIKRYIDKAIDYKKRIYQLNGKKTCSGRRWNRILDVKMNLR